jgi:hypothetical protein
VVRLDRIRPVWWVDAVWFDALLYNSSLEAVLYPLEATASWRGLYCTKAKNHQRNSDTKNPFRKRKNFDGDSEIPLRFLGRQSAGKCGKIWLKSEQGQARQCWQKGRRSERRGKRAMGGERERGEREKRRGVSLLSSENERDREFCHRHGYSSISFSSSFRLQVQPRNMETLYSR